MRWRQAALGEGKRDETRRGCSGFSRKFLKRDGGVFFLSVIIVGTHTH